MVEHTEITWQQVVAVHGSQAGISTKGGVVRSLLANQAKEGNYADEIRDQAIFYRVTSRTNPSSVRCLRGMLGTGRPFHVFEKVGKNRWLDHGTWVAAGAAQEAEGEVFILSRDSRP
jgi:hypothetical protein